MAANSAAPTLRWPRGNLPSVPISLTNSLVLPPGLLATASSCVFYSVGNEGIAEAPDGLEVARLSGIILNKLS